MKVITYFQEHGLEYLYLLWQHIAISAEVILIAMILAIPLGIFCSGNERMRKVFENFFGLLRIVPSLAILIVCIPIMGTGTKPAVLALSLLAIPPILMNTAQAFAALPADTIEAAYGVGMSARQVFFQVKLPMAFPLIFAGVRTATVEVIASATLASYIGAGGLGSIVFTGLGLMRIDLLYIGGVSVALLSMIAGYLMDHFYKYKTSYLRK